MSEKAEPCKNFDWGALVSLISCVRSDANLNTQLFWSALQRQLSFSGFLLVGLGLLYKVFGDVAALFIAVAGVITSAILFFLAWMNDRHTREYNDSCEQLESHLPEDIRPHAVMNTYKNKIEKKVRVRARTKLLILTVFLVLLWSPLLIWSGYQVHQNYIKKGGKTYEEVLPIPKERLKYQK